MVTDPSLCDLWDTMPRHWSPDASHPNPAQHLFGDLQTTAHRWSPGAPGEAEDFPRGDRHFKHVSPPTYLICLSRKNLYALYLLKPYIYLTMNHIYLSVTFISL